VSAGDFSPECERRLGYHPVVTDEQRAHYEENRRRFMGLYDYLATIYEPTRELSLALTALQEACMWANAHVACNGVGVD
jgi:hypothetical protein